MEKIPSDAVIKFYTRAMNFYASCILHLYIISPIHDKFPLPLAADRRTSIFASVKKTASEPHKMGIHGESVI
ncbi:MAG: hypothetical protein Q4C96_05630, partial [Planctomycetia bacterium]|nr:hypothetical protein [Planctomycetia bacterium]